MDVLSPEDKLKGIAQLLKQERPTKPVTVRDLLNWFGAQRRGPLKVEQIRDALESAELQTKPDFEEPYIDGTIEFILAGQEPVVTENRAKPGLETGQTVDPKYRIRRLPSANRGVTSVSPNHTVRQAITIMLADDFSQLPVMTNKRSVSGVISWRSIGKSILLYGKSITSEVREVMEPAVIVKADSSIFRVIDSVVAKQYILVRDENTALITGLVTTSDLSEEFHSLAEPFFRLGEIENQLRRLINSAGFTKDELQRHTDCNDGTQTVNEVSDLTFGGFVRILQNPQMWSRLRLSLDRTTFAERLDGIRQIRNDVMHFSPDPFDEEDLESLRRFSSFLDESLRTCAALSVGSAAQVVRSR